MARHGAGEIGRVREGLAVQVTEFAGESCSSTRLSNVIAPALSSGSLPLPHFGDCTLTDSRRCTRTNRSPRGWRRCSCRPPSRVRQSRTTRVGVVDEDGGAVGVDIGGGDAADVPAVADREERQLAIAVLGCAQRAAGSPPVSTTVSITSSSTTYQSG